MDITLDDVLTIFDEHYNNVKALDALNQQLFSTMDGGQRDCFRLGCLSLKTSPSSGCLPSLIAFPGLSSRVEKRPFLWWTH